MCRNASAFRRPALRVSAFIVLLGAPVYAAWAQGRPEGVPIVRDELVAALAVLRLRAAGTPVPDSLWSALFSSEGYQRLKERELAMRRRFTDTAFREFLLSDSLLARLSQIERSAAIWKQVDLRAAVAAAQAYLPKGAPIRASLYPLIKPATNSFVHRSASAGTMGIFLYLDPDQSASELHNTLAHELHHIGIGSVCRDVEDPGATPAKATLLTRLGGFSEGLAMLAAAGSPNVNPNAPNRIARQEAWNHSMRDTRREFAQVDTLIAQVADGRVTSADSVVSLAMTLYGYQGPWYTVGWVMTSSIERAFGRARLIEVMCDPRAMMREYNAAAVRLDPKGNRLPRWPEPTLRFLTPNRTAGQDSARDVRVRAELDRLYDLNAAAYMRGDLGALMELRSDGFHAIAANGALQDRAAMQVYMQGIINGIRQWNQLTMVIDSLRVEGDTAIAVVWQFLDRMALRPDNQVHHVQTWVTQRETWLYQGNRWLLWRVDQLRNQRRLVDGKPG